MEEKSVEEKDAQDDPVAYLITGLKTFQVYWLEMIRSTFALIAYNYFNTLRIFELIASISALTLTALNII